MSHHRYNNPNGNQSLKNLASAFPTSKLVSSRPTDMNTSFVSSLFLVLILATSAKAQVQSSPLPAPADVRQASGLTKKEFGTAQNIHWWTVKIPSDLGPKDMVGISFISSDGKEIDGLNQLSLGPGSNGAKFGPFLNVACWEDTSSGRMKLKEKVKGCGSCGTDYEDYLAHAVSSGPSNGSLLHPGDLLLKFDLAKNSTFAPGNALLPGQIGLRVAVVRQN